MRLGKRWTRFAPMSLVIAGALLTAGAAYADQPPVTADIAAGSNLFHNGKPGVSPCQSCHGPHGMGIDAMQTPRNQNLGYAYTVKQLVNFRSGARQDLTLGVMGVFAKQMTDQDIRNVAAYLNTIPDDWKDLSDLDALKAGGTPVGVAYKGMEIVRYGKPSRGITACQTCHQYDGRGAGPIYPRIAEQKYVYLVNMLHHWRAKERTNDPLGQMRAVASHLTDDDINNLAAFLSHARLTAIGDTFVPHGDSVLANIDVKR